MNAMPSFCQSATAKTKTASLYIDLDHYSRREFDGRLLAEGGRALKARLDPAQKKEVRSAFLRACEQRLIDAQAADGPD